MIEYHTVGILYTFRYLLTSYFLLLKQLERTLLRLVASLHQVLERLLAEGVLLSADDAALVLHEVLPGQTAGRLYRSSVPNASLCADGALSRGVGSHSIGARYYLAASYRSAARFIDPPLDLSIRR